jgi:hypothetical protein
MAHGSIRAMWAFALTGMRPEEMFEQGGSHGQAGVRSYLIEDAQALEQLVAKPLGLRIVK